MPQEISFQGLSFSPSDSRSEDGELATSLNVITEHGEISPIMPPKVVAKFTLPVEATIVLVHKVSHNNDIHTHYIIKYNGKYYWVEDNADTYIPNDIDLPKIGSINTVTAVGNILCFVSDIEIVYGFWKENNYTILSNTDFYYKINIGGYQLPHEEIRAEMGDEFWTNVQDASFGAQTEGDRIITGIKPSQLSNAMAALDAKLTTIHNDDDYLRYICFAVTALRLYDGSHFFLSNVFMLAPSFIDTSLGFNADESAGAKKYFSMKFSSHKHDIKIVINKDKLDTLIQGIDVFITKGETFLNLKNWVSDITYTNPEKKRAGVFKLSMLKEEGFVEQFDKLIFYHSIFIPLSKAEETYTIKHVLGTEEVISLANLYRNNFGAKCSITYNNRLHLANIMSSNKNAMLLNSSMTYETEIGSNRSFDNRKLLGQYPDIIQDIEDKEDAHWCKDGFSAEIILKLIGNNDEACFYSCQYPLMPILFFPFSNYKKAELYLHTYSGFYYKPIKLLQSSSTCFSMYINTYDDGNLRLLQVNDIIAVKSDGNDGNQFGYPLYFTATYNNTWEKITEKEFYNLKNATNQQHPTKYSSSLIRVSDVENPLVFPSKNSVQIGSSNVLGLASNTRPITEGQFGDAPLYAFTDEGTWMLMLSAEGTYQARQPINRIICSNPNNILQIDDAVIFPSEQGLMLQEGSKVACISSPIGCDGQPFNFLDLPSSDLILKLSNIKQSLVNTTSFREFLSEADTIYDYYNSRIIVFRSDYDYAYVYSLKSKYWSTMESPFRSRINTYPSSLAITRDGKIVDVYNRDIDTLVPYVVCTRPLSLGEPNVYKTMFSSIVRGFFSDAIGKCGVVLYGSNDLDNWYPIASSVNRYLRGMAGSPYKYFRIVMTGNLYPKESISSISIDHQSRWQNKTR